MARTKRILVLSDFHCGHLTGLTPPMFQWSNSDTEWRKAVCLYQKWAWKTYMSFVDEFRPYDRLLVLGDCVDGKGKLSGGIEQLTSDRNEQVDMAVACIRATKITDIGIARGTPYHTGVDENWENAVAREVKAEIGNHLFVKVNGTTISARHFVGGTQVPTGKATALLRTQVSNDQWVREYKEHPSCRIFLRGHVHRNIVIDEPATLSIIAPALQGWTDFGALKCSMPVHFGIIVLDIDKNGEWQWYRRTAKIGQFVHEIQW